MFTGITEEMGTVHALERDGDRARLTVSARTVLSDVAPGDSIAVDGCCLTVADLADDREAFSADLMAETLRVTSLGDRSVGDRVNLERALRADGRLGGHLVQGHVDGVGQVSGRHEVPGTVFLTVRYPPSLAPYVVPKGSVAVQGISLTVVDVDDAEAPTLRIGLIPHTCEVTTLGTVDVGARVNLEVDVVAKYVERLLTRGEVDSPYGR